MKDELRRLSHVSQLFPLPRCQFPKSFSSLAEIQSHLAAVELGILTVDRPGKDPAEAAAFPSTQAPAEAFQLPPAPGQRTPPPADLRPERGLTSPGIHSFTPSPPPKADAGEALVPEEAIECELERLRVRHQGFLHKRIGQGRGIPANSWNRRPAPSAPPLQKRAVKFRKRD